MDWVARIALLIIALVLVSLFLYSRHSKGPMPHQQESPSNSLESSAK
jgi:hypothetical protein